MTKHPQTPSDTVNFSRLTCTEAGTGLNVTGTVAITGRDYPVSATVPAGDGAWIGFTADGKLLTEASPDAFACLAFAAADGWHVITH